MTTFHQLENLAREICDSRNGAGHYDAKGTKRAHWRNWRRPTLIVREGYRRLTRLSGFSACGG